MKNDNMCLSKIEIMYKKLCQFIFKILKVIFYNKYLLFVKSLRCAVRINVSMP